MALMLSAAALLTGCSLFPDSDSDQPDNSIQTGRTSYTAELDRVMFGQFLATYRFEMIARLENTTQEMIYLSHLRPPV